MAFRRDSKIDAFQRQISALRHQLGGEDDYDLSPSDHWDRHPQRSENPPGGLLPLLDPGSVASSLATLSQGDRDRFMDDHSLPPVPAADLETSVIAHSTRWTGD